ncbi:hypothetical protein SAMN05192553_11133 [Cyclobacterium xiamenense]|uniref:Spheroidene monooxygenase n=2 Tax=Cyclobacterium xiamenense TaxID=1297121 RepID=A0A1H7BDS6_9BACT|nr:hypothetical protein SAMN05192553_11133 [Cyclobacterium xiamenense]
MSDNQEIVSLTFFEYPKRNRWWAFNQMQLALSPIRQVDGVSFFKLMGTGGGFGFSLKPDFRTYALLLVWKNAAFARMYSESEIYKRFSQQCKSNFTYWMRCSQCHGSWNGKQPFAVTAKATSEGPIMVITRARVKLRKIPRFLRFVPGSSRSAEKADGLLFTKGIGEWPAIEQATFSYWQSQQKMEAYAYQTAHRKIIQKVKKEGWYKEELFARFVPVSISNTNEVRELA